MKYYQIISLAAIFSGCLVLEKPQEQTIGSIFYSEQVSKKKKIIMDDSQSTPLISITSATIQKDSITQIRFTNKKTEKKYKGEYYYSFENSIDTIKSRTIDRSFVSSDFLLSGVFVPPKIQIPYPHFTDYGIKFLPDGTCTKTWLTHCSDSPCSTTHQTRGVYKFIRDTVSVTYFLQRFFSSELVSSNNDSPKSIDEAEWRVMEPYTTIFVLSQNRDTLNISFDSRYEIIKPGFYWLHKDSLTILPTKSKLD